MDKIVSYFDNIARNWDELRKCYFPDELKTKVKEGMVKDKDIIAADIGTGTGFIALELAKVSHSVIAIDVSTEMLKMAQKRAEEEGLKNLLFIKGEMQKIPLMDGSVDLVFTNMALHHVDDPLKGIQEMYRILKPGGSITIIDVEKHEFEWAKEEMCDLWLGFEPREISEWMQIAGFKNISVESSGYLARAVSKKGCKAEVGIFIAKGVK
ncbi:Ubiquinone/menaquinone biosynthesis C-methylase UbiE [Thermoanaerobacter thermohydrosulfuricus]|uniref:Methylase involved in ubiquinone/menaquinone biosynthesis n=2 Tax=Thermoanaerobacter thermohydrosulfuricus TaxID=1516 RepID=M8DQN6_THETY|nr:MULTISPECIES: class I SAM-dependent methyltransferase [Thermoanaerobacter]EMT38806.1 Methylase involved in ubiquinone/menaquinone biosynthesis [Thermoanaerobacter thermohydrosulfuricus WC1]SDG01100.1 Ubiquinone/menaquinone biosynthesis C-methylase UbiE [Thermoanaerobacter thermohydrosulfuricus]SFE45541.1 Ubiquinone/menaquinone biosynthesis C-methylase UbiE [Thermoanaerobacter thermohydrosulfuricus]